MCVTDIKQSADHQLWNTVLHKQTIIKTFTKNIFLHLDIIPLYNIPQYVQLIRVHF